MIGMLGIHMPLQSKLLKGDARLERCAIQDSAHITLNQTGDYVSKIQHCLIAVDNSKIDGNDIARKIYGASTASAVLNYKAARKIINYTYQKAADNIVGKMTIMSLDQEMLAQEKKPAPQPIRPHKTRFMPASSASHSVRSSGLVSARFTSADVSGYDPDPFRDDNQSHSTEAYQMVPANGSRTVAIFDPGFPLKKPTLRFVLRGPHVVKDEEVTIGGGPLRLFKLTGGSSNGAAFLDAINLLTNQVEATLQIAVLEKQTYTISFLDCKTLSGSVALKGSPTDWVSRVNAIWLSQANIECKVAGTASYDDVNLTWTGDNLRLLAPQYRKITEKLAGKANRYVCFMNRLAAVGDGRRFNGVTDEVMYISKESVGPDMRTLSHEFGHSLGRSHWESRAKPRNLMWTGAGHTDASILLNKIQINSSNMHPGTFRDVTRDP